MKRPVNLYVYTVVVLARYVHVHTAPMYIPGQYNDSVNK